MSKNIFAAIAGGVNLTEAQRTEHQRKPSSLHPAQLLESYKRRPAPSRLTSDDPLFSIAGACVTQSQARLAEQELLHRAQMIEEAEIRALKEKKRNKKEHGSASLGTSVEEQFKKSFGVDMEEMIEVQMKQERERKALESKKASEAESTDEEEGEVFEGRLNLFRAAEMQPDSKQWQRTAVSSLRAWRPDLCTEESEAKVDGHKSSSRKKQANKKKSRKKRADQLQQGDPSSADAVIDVTAIHAAAEARKVLALKRLAMESSLEVVSAAIEGLLQRVERIAAHRLVERIHLVILTAASSSTDASKRIAAKDKKSCTSLSSVRGRKPFILPQSRFVAAEASSIASNDRLSLGTTPSTEVLKRIQRNLFMDLKAFEGNQIYKYEDHIINSVELCGFESNDDRRRRRKRETIDREKNELQQTQEQARRERQRAKEERHRKMTGSSMDGESQKQSRHKKKSKIKKKKKNEAEEENSLENSGATDDTNTDPSSMIDSHLASSTSISATGISKSTVSKASNPSFTGKSSSLTPDDANSKETRCGILHFDWSCLGQHCTMLDISRNGLSGRLPFDAISTVRCLRVLYVHGNAFTGPLPHLSPPLRAPGAEWSGALPASVGVLPHLTDINFSGNQFTGTLAPVSGAEALKILWAADNRLTGPVGALLPSPQLSSLRLGGNRIEGPLGALILDRSALARAALAEAREAIASTTTGSAVSSSQPAPGPTATSSSSSSMFSAGFFQMPPEEVEARGALAAAAADDGSVTCLLPRLAELDLRDNAIRDARVPPLLGRLAAEKLWNARRSELRDALTYEAAAAVVDRARRIAERKSTGAAANKGAVPWRLGHEMEHAVRSAPMGTPLPPEVRIALASMTRKMNAGHHHLVPRQEALPAPIGGLTPLVLKLHGNPGFAANGLVPCFPPFLAAVYVDHFEEEGEEDNQTGTSPDGEENDAEEQPDLDFYDTLLQLPAPFDARNADDDALEAHEKKMREEAGNALRRSRFMGMGRGGKEAIKVAAATAAASSAGSHTRFPPGRPAAFTCKYPFYVMTRETLLNLAEVRGGAFAVDVEKYQLEPPLPEWLALPMHEEALESGGLLEVLWPEPFDDSFGHSCHRRRRLAKLRKMIRRRRRRVGAAEDQSTANRARRKEEEEEEEEEEDRENEDDENTGMEFCGGSWRSVHGGGYMEPSCERIDPDATAMVLAPWWGLGGNMTVASAALGDNASIGTVFSSPDGSNWDSNRPVGHENDTPGQKKTTLAALQDLVASKPELKYIWFEYFSVPQRRDPGNPRISRDDAAASIPYYALCCGHFIVLSTDETYESDASVVKYTNLEESTAIDDLDEKSEEEHYDKDQSTSPRTEISGITTAEYDQPSVAEEHTEFVQSESQLTTAVNNRNAASGNNSATMLPSTFEEDPYIEINNVESSKLGDFNATAWNRLVVLSAVHAARYHGFAGPHFPERVEGEGRHEDGDHYADFGGDGSWRRRFCIVKQQPAASLTGGSRVLRVSTAFFEQVTWLPNIEDPRLGMLGGNPADKRADKQALELPALSLAAALNLNWRPNAVSNRNTED